MQIRQSEEYVGQDWWKWAIWLEGAEQELDQVEYVEWRLHPTFPDPVRKSTDRGTGFRLETGGWGVFPIHASVRLKDGQTLKLRHLLQLHFPDGTQNTA
jgi:transcription initiation factor IIF auxiliary subunit